MSRAIEAAPGVDGPPADDALTGWRFTTEQEQLQRQAVATAQRAANIARAQMQAGTVDVTVATAGGTSSTGAIA